MYKIWENQLIVRHNSKDQFSKDCFCLSCSNLHLELKQIDLNEENGCEPYKLKQRFIRPIRRIHFGLRGAQTLKVYIYMKDSNFIKAKIMETITD